METTARRARTDARSWVTPELSALVAPSQTMATALAPEATDALGSRRPTWIIAARRPLVLLLMIGVFVSFTATGRLLIGHVAWAMIGWAFLVVMQLFGLTLTVALFRRARLSEWARLVDASYLTRAPWLLWLVGMTLWHTLFADAGASFFSVFLTRFMMIVLVTCALWSRVIDHAFWRALGLGRAAALLAVVVHDVMVLGPGIVWYLATDQLQPLLFGAPT